MTQQERAEVTFKGLGIVLLASAIRPASGMMPAALSGGGALSASGRAALAAVVLIPAIFGVAFITAARLLARRLLPACDPAPPPPEEALATGVCTAGLFWMCAAAAMIPPALLLPMGTPDVGVGLARALAAISVILAAVSFSLAFALRPRSVAAFCGRVAGGPPQSMLTAGLWLIGLWFGTRGLLMVLSTLSVLIESSHHVAMTDGRGPRWVLGWVASAGSAVLLAVLLLRCARGIASRFGRAADMEGAAGDGIRLGGTAALALVVQVVIAGLLMGVDPWSVRTVVLGDGRDRLIEFVRGIAERVGDLLGLAQPGLDAAADVAGALFAVAMLPLLAVVALWLAGRLAWPTARLVHKPAAPDAETAAPALPILLEVGLAVLGLYLAIDLLCSAALSIVAGGGAPPAAAPYRFEPALAALGALAVVLLKGDLALMTVRDGAAQEAGRATRAALLGPWLVLLGAWLVLRDGPAMVSWAAMALARASSAWTTAWPPWGAVPGLLLIVCARPIARLLSFGPLLRRPKGEG